MTKLRWILTAFVLALYGLFIYFFNLFEAPIRGAATAGQLTNNAADYAWFKFVANDGISNLAFAVMVIALAIIWISSIFTTRH